ncbi:hypothetical protein JOC95_002027 [Bacillus tianshenii]|uniref:Uncharacterized protein n=1 Tax=Sutcliffiella tianshenii TaxID=1463404 RepID=A0ABS2NZP3_9BACI|nr:hypothetical protein [Bacillus tianshenii]MBM7620174.1 hypothetical protein [Bacillus tianshenii]
MKIDSEVQRQYTEIVNSMYEFNPYFNLLLNGEFFRSRGVPIVNEYPPLKATLEKYRKVIAKLKKRKYHEKTMLNILSNENFTQEIGLNNNPNSFYTVNWDVDKLISLVGKYHLKPQTLPIEIVMSRLSTGSVPYVDDSMPIREEPIIVVQYPMISEVPQIIVVDGNYRTVRKYTRGDETIDVFPVPQHIHMQAMLNDLSVTSYKVHHNCFHIIRYMMGEITESKELKSFLFRF